MSRYHVARVYLSQARHFRLRGGRETWWVVTLLQWAARARREAAGEPRQEVLL